MSDSDSQMPRAQIPLFPFRETGNRLALDENITVTSALECGNGKNLNCVGPAHFTVELISDEVPISEAMPECYVCVRVTNESPQPREVKIDIIVPRSLIDNNWTYMVNNPYYVRRGDVWETLPQESCIIGMNIYRVIVQLDANETVLVSNAQPYPYSTMSARLQDWATEYSDRAHLHSIGKTAQGRDIWMLSLGLADDKPHILMHGTPQPNEVGAVAAEGVIEFLLGDSTEAVQLLKRYTIHVIPQPNPDGVVLGKIHVNSKGQMVGYGYAEAVAGHPDAPEEAKAIWKWIVEHRPIVLIDMHGLWPGYADRPTLPYIFDKELYHSDTLRALIPHLDRALIALDEEGAYRFIEKDRVFWSGMVTYQAIDKFDTIAYLYDMWGLGAKGTKHRIVQVMRTVIDFYEKLRSSHT